MMHSRTPATRSGAIVLLAAVGLADVASGGEVPFTERVISDTVDGAQSVFAADLDGDGDMDALSASSVDDKIAWYESDGGAPPAFSERVISVSADGARSVFAADLDGDGDLDALSASADDDKIAWYENDGGSPPAFTERTISVSADGAWSVFAADLDGDGDLDVLSASYDDDKIAWYENDGGRPTFTERVISVSADLAKSVFAADLDADGDIDVLSASTLDDKIAWYENDGGSPPAFTEQAISVSADGAQRVFASDLDGDGDVDVLAGTTYEDTMPWYENDGGSPPAFTERVISDSARNPFAVIASDLDGDGDLDVLSALPEDGKITWYESDGGAPPAFTERLISDTGGSPRSVFASDLDGDGDTDALVALAFDDTIAWYENTSRFAINQSTGTCYSTIGRAIDAARDGDTLVAHPEMFPDEPVVDFQGKSLTLASRGEIVQPAGGHYQLADGVALETALGTDARLDGHLVVPPAADVDLAADHVTLGPDGHLVAETAARLFVTSGAAVDGGLTLETGATAVFDGDVSFAPSAASFTDRLITGGRDSASGVFTADLDGDGDTDVLSASTNDNTVAWYENDGQTPPTLTTHVISNDALGAWEVSAADVDGDGDLDVLPGNGFAESILWYENDGGAPPAFTERTVTDARGNALALHGADVDGDGDTDVMAAVWADELFAWYENDGGSPPAFTEHVFSPNRPLPSIVSSADLDGDGDVDLLTMSVDDDKAAWHENDGGSPPVFTEHVITDEHRSAVDVATGDLDRDGDTDVVCTFGIADLVAWYESDGGAPPTFTEHILLTGTDGARAVAVTDLDGDGDDDILTTASLGDQVLWHESDGGTPPLFTTNVISAAIDGPFAAALGDVDGDGDADAVIAAIEDDAIVWLENEGGTTSLAGGALLAAEGDLEIARSTAVTGARLAAGGVLLNEGHLRLLGGSLAAGGGLVNDATIEGYGDVETSMMNAGHSMFLADTQVVGDYENTGTTTVKSGTLTVLGTLTNHGRLVGDLGEGYGPAELFVEGDLQVGADASLLVPSADAVVRAGSAYDVAIDDSARYHLARAELRLVATGGQTLEVMSLDRGPDSDGLDRTLPGSFPIGTLRLGPTSTRVALVDAHDNARDGQSACEAIYVETLVLDAGTTLVTNGCRVYYVNARIDGSVDDPANVVEIGGCPEDLSGNGFVDFADLLIVLALWGETDRPEDLDGSGVVDFGDLLVVLSAWGVCP